MRENFGEWTKMTLYVIFGVLFVIASYIILLNIHHYKNLSEKTVVSEVDNEYVQYKDNVNMIEERVNKYINKNSEEYTYLSNAIEIMKKDGVFRLVPKAKLGYGDLYEINNYYLEELINKAWINNLNKLDISKKYQDTIIMLANNSNYINSVFNSNSLSLYDNSLDNKIDNNYHFILRNYLMYSNVILEICNGIGGVNE